MRTRPVEMRWIDDGHLAFDDVVLELYLAPEVGPPAPPVPRLRLEKSRSMVEFYQTRFARGTVTNMIEVGVRYGGSVVLFHKLLAPARLLAFDIAPERIPALDDYLRKAGAGDAVHLHFGVDQGDGPTVRRIVAEEFGREPLDVVIDDGCHWLEETRRCFNTLFPYVRAGGAYVIEDWSWAHWGAPEWQEGGGMWRGRPSLTTLILELAMLSGSRPDLVESVHVSRDLVVLTKGSAPVGDDFDLSTSYVTGGRRYVELPPRVARPPSAAFLNRLRGLLRREGARGVLRRASRELRRALGR